MNFNNHLKNGNVTVEHRKKLTTTSFNVDSFERTMESIMNSGYQIVTVPIGYEHRADLISNVFFGTPTLDWLICWYNGIEDPFEGLNRGDKIKIPRL